MNDAVRSEIEALRKLTLSGLRAKYLELFGEASRSANRGYLFRRLAWRLQARVAGDLSQCARERARQLALDADLRLGARRSFWNEVNAGNASNPNSQRDPRLPLPGAELTRKHQGHTIRVKVLEHGFEYQGKRFASLSAIAYRATGTRWNGFSFFSLKHEAANG